MLTCSEMRPLVISDLVCGQRFTQLLPAVTVLASLCGFGTLSPDIDFDFKVGLDRFHRAKPGTLILPKFNYILSKTYQAQPITVLDQS